MVDATDEDGTWINGDFVEPEKPDPLNSSYSGKNFEYDGQLDKEDGVPSGYGKAYDSKKSWTGDWRYGYIYGIAEVKYYNGERFTGTLDNNQPLTGTYTWPDRYSFEGTFKNGHASGIGLLIGLGGVFYAGYVRDTLMNGYGKLYKADGTFIKEGIWQNNKFLLNKKDSNLAIEKIVQIKLQKIKDLNTARDINNPVSIFTDSTWKNVQLEEYNVLLVTKKDGSIWRLGKNDHTSTNQLLTEVVDKYYTSVEVGKPNEWKTIKCLGHFSVGLKNDGTIWKWVSGKPVQIGTGKEWASIDEDRYEAVLIKNDGTLWSYYDRDTAVKQMGLDNDWVKIFCGHNGCGFAQKRDGTIWGWGANENGQLGSGDDYNIKELRRLPIPATKDAPIQITKSADWKYISSSNDFTLFIKENGTLWGCGKNTDYQLGIRLFTTSPKIEYSPIQLGKDTDWLQVSAATDYALALKKDGSMWAWGTNTEGCLGVAGDAIFDHYKEYPVQVGKDTDWKIVCAGHKLSYALKNDGSLWEWGSKTERVH